MSTLAARVVVVSRRSELDELLARHGTTGAAEFFLRSRGREIADVQARHEAVHAALTEVVKRVERREIEAHPRNVEKL